MDYWRALCAAPDAFSKARNALRRISEKAGEYAGVPMDIEGESLVVEPSYAFARFFKKNAESYEEPGVKIRNYFYSKRHRCGVYIFEEGGKVQHALEAAFDSIDYQLRTLGCSVAWGYEQEAKAQELLANLIKPNAMKHYLMTGQFLETSPRSGVTYMFRRLRPTIAMSKRTGSIRILCCLCMHPIAYYSESWAGAMCPTDDVIAHLMLMRGDEAMFWRRCNQHPRWRPQAGI